MSVGNFKEKFISEHSFFLGNFERNIDTEGRIKRDLDKGLAFRTTHKMFSVVCVYLHENIFMLPPYIFHSLRPETIRFIVRACILETLKYLTIKCSVHGRKTICTSPGKRKYHSKNLCWIKKE